MHPVQLISDFADQAVVLPLAGAILLLLLVWGEPRAATWWTGAVAIALTGIVTAKLALIPCGHLMPGLDLRSPSGHTGSATAIYGGLLMLFARARTFAIGRAAALALVLVIAAIIAATRILLHAHSLEEVLAGAMIGATTPLLLALPTRLFSGHMLEQRWTLALPLLVIPVFVGHRAATESWLTIHAWQLAHWLGACGF